MCVQSILNELQGLAAFSPLAFESSQQHANRCHLPLMQAMLETEKDMDATRQRLHRLEEERCGPGPVLCCSYSRLCIYRHA